MHAIAIEATATIRFSSIWLIFVAFCFRQRHRCHVRPGAPARLHRKRHRQHRLQHQVPVKTERSRLLFSLYFPACLSEAGWKFRRAEQRDIELFSSCPPESEGWSWHRQARRQNSGRKHTCRFQVKIPSLIIIYRSQNAGNQTCCKANFPEKRKNRHDAGAVSSGAEDDSSLC